LYRAENKKRLNVEVSMQTAQQHPKIFNLSDYMNDDLGAEPNGSSATIGPEGGVVTVTNPRSPIFGTSLRIPPGALDDEVRITIEEGEHSCDFGLSPTIKLLPDGLQFKRATTLTVFLNELAVESDDFDESVPELYHYNESNDQWACNSAIYLEQMGDAVMCELHHF
jgi:hypothetical protein